MGLRLFQGFSLEEGGFLEDSEREHMEAYFLNNIPYVFDCFERWNDAYSRMDERIDGIEPLSIRSRLYRIISSSEKTKNAVGVEITNPIKKESIYRRIQHKLTKQVERENWEICQGWHSREI